MERPRPPIPSTTRLYVKFTPNFGMCSSLSFQLYRLVYNNDIQVFKVSGCFHDVLAVCLRTRARHGCCDQKNSLLSSDHASAYYIPRPSASTLGAHDRVLDVPITDDLYWGNADHEAVPSSWKSILLARFAERIPATCCCVSSSSPQCNLQC